MFDQTLYKSHVDYLKTNCLKALDILKVVGHTDWGGRSENSTLALLSAGKIQIGLWLHCIWGGLKMYSTEAGP